jgi:hypothetical protein
MSQAEHRIPGAMISPCHFDADSQTYTYEFYLAYVPEALYLDGRKVQWVEDAFGGVSDNLGGNVVCSIRELQWTDGDRRSSTVRLAIKHDLNFFPTEPLIKFGVRPDQPK